MEGRKRQPLITVAVARVSKHTGSKEVAKKSLEGSEVEL